MVVVVVATEIKLPDVFKTKAGTISTLVDSEVDSINHQETQAAKIDPLEVKVGNIDSRERKAPNIDSGHQTTEQIKL